MQFEAKVRVILKPLVGLIPIVGGIQVCDSILLAGLIIEVYYHFMVKISFFAHTEMRFILCTRLGEISSCSYLTVLPGPALVQLTRFAKNKSHLCIGLLAMFLVPDHTNHTEMRFILCTWFGEFCSCCSLMALPGPA